MTRKFTLDAIFNPRSVAVIGASRREEAVGHAVFKNILTGGYQGTVYPVNPKAESILGVRCYHSLQEIPGTIDLAVLIVPADSAVSVFQECVQKETKAVVIISAGFKEIGAQGAALEQEIGRIAREHQIPLVGPNCLGVINTDPAVSLNASFGRTMPKLGNIAFISQSGALCTAVLDYAKGANIGFSKFISMGNKALVTELELLQYLGQDDKTDVILMYLEDLVYPREMIEVCRQISGDDAKRKPILAIKSGRTLEGAKAASSHTGSLAGSDEVFTAIFAQGGILRVDSVDELFDYAKAFSSRKLPRRNRVAIVTNAGGPGIMATDACVRYGLEMAALKPKTKEALKKWLPPTAGLNNPVDVIGDAQHDRYEAALKNVLRDPHVDAVIAILTPQAMTDIEQIAEVVGKVNARTGKVVLASFMGIADVTGGVKILEKWKVPHYRFPESAAKSLGAMARYTAWVVRPRTGYKEFKVDRERSKAILAKAGREGRKNLTDLETFSVLDAYGFSILPAEIARTAAEAGDAAERMGYPVALKISSPDILHKFDVKGVRLNLKNRGEVVQAAKGIFLDVPKKNPAARIAGLIVQKMSPKGRELILGLKRDPRFGAILMFGMGGTYVEVLKDVTFRLAPIRQLGAHNMIRSIRTYKLLEGTRGEKVADIRKLEENLERLSQLACECVEITELDVNPLMVHEKGAGCTVVDARILLSS
ncbi:MAG: acetate--CoA ligase family protein [Candidatus Omnitrophica bacterium]|nr:acetate--CoA ligase family protein [Candidatus Omnitrophota bacterium]